MTKIAFYVYLAIMAVIGLFLFVLSKIDGYDLWVNCAGSFLLLLAIIITFNACTLMMDPDLEDKIKREFGKSKQETKRGRK